jgi:hypothetical protein
MYGLKDLKEKINITETTVECPVKDCDAVVERQRNSFKREKRFYCPEHKIFISLSTFEYQNEIDNLLWKDQDDLELLKNIKIVKRESRMARDNSEDVLSWNVFRFLEKNKLVEKVMGAILDIPIKSPEIIYWSYSQKEDTSWPDLNKARTYFGEQIKRGSEPDIIIKSENALFFIEAKLSANNETRPTNLNDARKYEEKDKEFYSQIFQSDFNAIAVQEKKYELLRFWLLGNWIAAQKNLDFYLINLVLEERDHNIETDFGKHIVQGRSSRFIRISWEDIYSQILKDGAYLNDTHRIIEYFKNKTIGYDGLGQLQKAFTVN